MESAWDDLKEYQPQKIEDDFEIMKANFNCAVEYSRIEKYDGPIDDLKGKEFLNYCLIVLNHPKYTGRKLWKKVNLSNSDQLKKLADTFFTVGLEFNDRLSLESANEKFATMTVKVRAWGWTPDKDINGNEIDEGKREARQMFQVKGLAKEEAKDKILF